MDTLILYSKMRALLWVKAAFNECRVQERLWWFCPYKCSFLKSVSRGWCYPPHEWLKFNVSGIASEGVLGGGRVMRDEEGIVKDLFSGSSDACNAETAKLGAIITTLDVFIETDLERRIVCVEELSFSIAELNGNEMTDTLATTGMSRPSMFKAW
ncbi:hypothetical protein PVK06_046378 [Gossypium arboreum]|uniref:RNase H type-1 domain-containing protein n=1 Tax=Gossypium arboreum TaxID=29729 RepID=A0ABR0MAR9_GOSAR|nr:hypothetical protein PVK06_046378 [Gossypium arboreum]